MNTSIYYFSGSGNALAIALRTARELEAKLLPIALVSKQEEILADTQEVGFIFPMYYGQLPKIVEHFIKKIDLSRVNYIFVLMVRTGGPGKAFFLIDKLLKEKGKKMSAAFKINMLPNYVREYNPPHPWFHKGILERAYKKWDKVIALVKMKKHKIEKDPAIMAYLPNPLYNRWVKNLNSVWEKQFYADQKCISCGVCQKICPVDNIKLTTARRPDWQGHCEDCLACFHFCPERAIQIGKKTLKRRRIHNPEITIGDMCLQKNRADIFN